MSLEQAIQDHASAIRELAAAIRGAGTGQVGATAAHVTEAAKVVEKAQASSSSKKSETKKPDPKPDPVEAPVEEESAATQKQKGDDAVAEVEVTRDQVRNITLELGKAGKRDALIALLSDLGVAKSSELADDQLGEFFTRATDLLGA